jgi:protein-tyrosine phosphatase
MNRNANQPDPLQVDFIAAAGLPAAGRLGLTFAPGRNDPALRSGSGQPVRDLNSDLRRMVEHYGLTTLVSLLEDFEYPLLEIAELVSRAEAHGIEVIRYPIRDMSVPPADAMAGFASLISGVSGRITSGETVVVHCRAGFGRSGLVAAAVLVAAGQAPEDAISAVRSARPGTIETAEQERYVHDFAEHLQARNA